MAMETSITTNFLFCWDKKPELSSVENSFVIFILISIDLNINSLIISSSKLFSYY